MNESGPCALCEEVRPLCLSHLLAAAFYRALRDDEDDGSNPNPFLLTGETFHQTSQQVRQRLLCQDCEQKFSRLGEKHVIERSHRRGGKFRLREQLAQLEPIASKSGTQLFAGDDVKGFDPDQVGYFAASVIWRASVVPWGRKGHAGSIRNPLGPYETDFASFLRCEGSLIDIGRPSRAFPVTPPGIRVTYHGGSDKLSVRNDRHAGKAERVEVGIG